MTDSGSGAPEGGRRRVNREQLVEHAKTINEATVAAVRQMAILWEAQINLALAADDDDALHDIVTQRPVAFTDTNCSCGSGGGGSMYFG